MSTLPPPSEPSGADRPGTTPSITRTHPPAPHGDPRDPSRRPLAAGHVVLVAVVALVVGSFLNAAGILKTAKGQPLGWRRDVALAFAQPVYDVSHFLHTDRLRARLQDLLGRAGDDAVDESLPSPTTLPRGSATTLPPRVSFSPSNKLRLWIGGDSLGDFPGTSIVNQLAGNDSVDVVAPVEAHISTGLARPEVLNWPAEMSSVIRALNPRAVVLSLGSNDNQPLTGEGATGAPFGSDAWRSEYSRRVGGLMDTVVSGGHTLFWIGIPIVRQEDKLESYQFLNAIYREQAAMRPGRVFYVDTYNLLKGSDANYADYLPNTGGDLVLARAPDGTHYTRFGADKIATAVIARMNEAFNFGAGSSTPTTPAPATTVAPTTTRRR